MRLRKELMLFSVVSIIFLAGCARGPEGPTGAGVIIQSFAPDVSTVDSGTPVSFILSVKNVGGKPATNAHAVLFGLSDKWTDAIMDPDKDKLESIATPLVAADPTTGLPGEEATKVWTVDKTPLSSTDITYDANVRVQYTYKTESTGFVRVVSSDYLRTNPDVQRGVTNSQTTAGPLVVNFFARSPVVTDTNKAVRLQIEVQNVGGGKTFAGGAITPSQPVTTTMLNKIKITIGDSATCKVPIQNKDVLLIGGKSAIINCEKDVATTTFTDITFPVTIDYGYFVDSATQVTVLKALQ